MIAGWLYSLAINKASIVDSLWGPGFIVIAWLVLALAPDLTPEATDRGLLVALMTTAWGLRLAVHVTRRNWNKPEDARYAEMRAVRPERFWLWSLFGVFLIQAAVMWVVSLPVQTAALLTTTPGFGWLDLVGVLVFAFGLGFEALGDWQLTVFKADPANKGKVMDQGLWRYTRHPNYFGETLVWWGMWLVACSVPWGWLSFVGPLLITWLLLKVSGVTLLDRKMLETRPAYRDYMQRTSAFFPWPPKAPQPGDTGKTS
jgi:steroid 5-alpha reductase family enzyme